MQSGLSLRYSHEDGVFGYQNAPSKDCNRTARMRMLIRIIAGRTCLKVRCGSYLSVFFPFKCMLCLLTPFILSVLQAKTHVSDCFKYFSSFCFL